LSEPDRQHPDGGWRFILRSSNGVRALEASDREPGVRGERLELLAVVRGLEALEQPSKITLITPSQYVKQGITHGLTEWRENGWTWERFGEMAPVKHRDLWQRLDRALKYHQVDCRAIRLDPAHVTRKSTVDRFPPVDDAEPESAGPEREFSRSPRSKPRAPLNRRVRRAILRGRRAWNEQIEGWRVMLEQWGVVPAS
jgi:ribonuclease HI